MISSNIVIVCVKELQKSNFRRLEVLNHEISVLKMLQEIKSWKYYLQILSGEERDGYLCFLVKTLWQWWWACKRWWRTYSSILTFALTSQGEERPFSPLTTPRFVAKFVVYVHCRLIRKRFKWPTVVFSAIMLCSFCRWMPSPRANMRKPSSASKPAQFYNPGDNKSRTSKCLCINAVRSAVLKPDQMSCYLLSLKVTLLSL